MDETSTVMLAGGALLFITRGMLLIIPGPIRVLYLRSLLTPMTIRLSGLIAAALTGLGIQLVMQDRGTAAMVSQYVLWAFLAYTLLAKVIFAGAYSNGMRSFWGDMADGTLRFLGLIFAGISGALIYFGYIWA